MPPSNETKAKIDTGVATEDQNAKLKHTEGGVTTRSDATDLGVPMLPGSPDERQGPEDALGDGPKRGDYRKRLGGVEPYEMVAVPDTAIGGDTPVARAVPQLPRVNDIGDEKGKKGGVDSATT